MILLILENVSPSLKGTISKWLIEIKAGVFVGNVNSLIKDLLWEKCMELIGEGEMTMIWTNNSEQGFELRQQNNRDYIPINIEGLWLCLHPVK